jgi:hypothetical protein
VIASRTLKGIGDAVPVRLMKRDLQFLSGSLTTMLDERRLTVLIRQNRVGKAKDGEAPAKLIMAALQKVTKVNSAECSYRPPFCYRSAQILTG